MSGHIKNQYESLPSELTEQEKESIYHEPRMQEIREWIARLKHSRDGFWLNDAKFSTVVSNVKFLLEREDYRERLIRFSRTRWLRSHIQCMRLKDQLKNIQEKYGVVVKKRPDSIKLSTYREDQLEKIAMRLESQENKAAGINTPAAH